jgi:hypothetical protein
LASTGTWIESHTSLRANKKLKPLCEDLRVTRATIIGHLHMLWWWAIDNREDGDLSSLYPRDIAGAADWPGDPLKFVNALKRHGWLTKDMHIKDWMEYVGRLISERRRKRAQRARHSQDAGADGHGTRAGQDADASAATIPDHTVPDSTVKEGLFTDPQEKTLRALLAGRFKHAVGSTANDAEYKFLCEGVESAVLQGGIESPMGLAVHRATPKPKPAGADRSGER